MKIYLGSRFGRRGELAGYRDELQNRGLGVITSRWLFDPDNWTGETVTPEIAMMCAEHDLDDLAAADLVVIFTGGPTKGGYHTEFGLAVAMNKKVVLVGERECVFHWLPFVHQFDAFEDFLYAAEVNQGLTQLLGAA